MEYFVNGKIIRIEEDEKPFSFGSEGKLYKREETLYKIYYEEDLRLHQEKYEYHALLSTLNTHQINLPIYLIYQNNDNFTYAGYVVKKINRRKKRPYGATKMDGKSFIQNLKIWSNESKFLATNYILMADVGFHNYVYDEDKEKMMIVDPGKYQSNSAFTIEQYLRYNQRAIEALTKQILIQDMNQCNEIRKRKNELIMKKINKEIGSNSIIPYLEKQLNRGNYETVEQYLIEKARYIR